MRAPVGFMQYTSKKYSLIRPPRAAFSNWQDKNEIERLLNQLAEHDNEPFPAEIDAEFAKLAEARRAVAPLGYYLWLPLRRLLALWWNPRNSTGWPVSLDVGVFRPPPENLFEIALANPGALAVKIGASVYRIGLLAAAVLIALYWSCKKPVWLRLVWLALAYAGTRSVFMGWGFFMESRYLLQAVLFIEVAVAVGVFEFST